MSYTYDYPRPMLTVDAVVFRQNGNNPEVLLIRRKHYPFEGKWALPGGFVDMDETLEEAVVRELKEETGLKNVDLKQLHAFSTIDRDPRGRTISVIFFGFVDMENSTVIAGDDARDARWFDANEFPHLAFDHNKVVEMALRRISV
ncbi:MAG: NUDIX hydrolase [Bacteroidetes bacterium]|nr:NUDIX hydrolase [Bacteroidota bacterium]MBL7105231.1 NUDIX hydrolase [Bacteroidales bacterium]